MITIVDYGVGNLKSIVNMLRKCGHDSIATSSPEDLLCASKIILPGVGAFDAGMKNLRSRELDVILNEAVIENKVPCLGICLGMQLLASQSEEGESEGLGWIPASVKRFNLTDKNLKTPHMGWNLVTPTTSCVLFEDIPLPMKYYFVHSYHFTCDDPSDSVGKTVHGAEFTSVINKGNIYGAQFHPEKSHRYGMKLLKNFAEKT